MQFFSESTFRCDAVADIAFTTVMSVKDAKVVPTIRALFYASDPLFIRLSH